MNQHANTPLEHTLCLQSLFNISTCKIRQNSLFTYLTHSITLLCLQALLKTHFFLMFFFFYLILFKNVAVLICIQTFIACVFPTLSLENHLDNYCVLTVFCQVSFTYRYLQIVSININIPTAFSFDWQDIYNTSLRVHLLPNMHIILVIPSTSYRPTIQHFCPLYRL